jgi:hypothetical protein
VSLSAVVPVVPALPWVAWALSAKRGFRNAVEPCFGMLSRNIAGAVLLEGLDAVT